MQRYVFESKRKRSQRFRPRYKVGDRVALWSGAERKITEVFVRD